MLSHDRVAQNAEDHDENPRCSAWRGPALRVLRGDRRACGQRCSAGRCEASRAERPGRPLHGRACRDDRGQGGRVAAGSCAGLGAAVRRVDLRADRSRRGGATIVFADGTQVRTNPRKGMRSSLRLSQELRERVRDAANCAANPAGGPSLARATPIGHETVAGHRAVRLRFEGGGTTAELWYAVEAGCAPLKVVMDVGEGGRSESNLVTLDRGEPIPALSRRPVSTPDTAPRGSASPLGAQLRNVMTGLMPPRAPESGQPTAGLRTEWCARPCAARRQRGTVCPGGPEAASAL